MGLGVGLRVGGDHLLRRATALMAPLVVLTFACGPVGPGDFPPVNPELVLANQEAGDPYSGRFPYREAVAGLPSGRPFAVLETSAGEIPCQLAIDTAPLTVANFIGLARGLRPFQVEPDGPWVREPFYVDLAWHRAVERQFVQTGRRGERERPGFRLQDERSIGDAFDGPGVLAMANEGTEHSGAAQFFVTTDALRALDGQYTIFGRCSAPLVVRELERQVLEGGEPPRLLEVRIEVQVE